ncbi:Alpha/Beta hydrolase protein [Gorgonomyces haynaldii]|nr:Alpha/Beta hydrolase protein [Gorgonomyces haynaldii]
MDFEFGCKYFTTKPTKVELLKVGNHSIHYELHGSGPKRLVLVMGLLSSMGGWSPVVDHFCAKRSDYTVLVLDNRGVGYSENGPFAIYSTESMAKDVLAVMDHIGWKDNVHLAGISMGGMISQHIAYLAGERFLSLLLLATCAKHIQPEADSVNAWTLLKPHQDFGARADQLIYRTFSDEEWLNKKDDRYPEFDSNRDRMRKLFVERMEKNPNKSPLKSIIGQGLGVQWHSMSDDKLQVIRQKIPKITCVTGTADRMIHPNCTKHLGEKLQCKTVFLEGRGHGLPHESEQEVIQEFELLHE